MQEYIMQSIRSIKSNYSNSVILPDIQKAVNDLIFHSADIILIACTELSLLTNDLRSDIPLYDANKILAKHIVKFCKHI